MKRFIITDLENADNVKHCIGCFGCFFKTPGKCIILDECQEQGMRLGHCDEIVIVSKLTFGGYSKIVKKRFDRSLPYVHADFHIFQGQMHHKERYENDPTLKVYFYGDGTDAEKENAKILVKRNSYNLALTKYEVYFCETAEQAIEMTGVNIDKNNEIKESVVNIENNIISENSIIEKDILNVAILNGSPRGKKGASGSVSSELKNRILQSAGENAVIDNEEIVGYRENSELKNCWRKKVKVSEYFLAEDSLKESLELAEISELCSADWMIFVFPLYLDSPPSNLQACMEDLVSIKDRFKNVKVSCIALAGLYEGDQTKTAINMIKYWTKEMGFQFIKGTGFGGSGSLPGLRKMMPGEGCKKELLNLYDQIILANIKGVQEKNIYKNIGITLQEYKDSSEEAFRKLAQKNGFSVEDMGKQW